MSVTVVFFMRQRDPQAQRFKNIRAYLISFLVRLLWPPLTGLVGSLSFSRYSLVYQTPLMSHSSGFLISSSDTPRFSLCISHPPTIFLLLSTGRKPLSYSWQVQVFCTKSQFQRFLHCPSDRVHKFSFQCIVLTSRLSLNVLSLPPYFFDAILSLISIIIVTSERIGGREEGALMLCLPWSFDH